MSDIMLEGVLLMPYEMAMSNEIGRHQYWQRGQQAVEEIKRLRDKFTAANELAERNGLECVRLTNELTALREALKGNAEPVAWFQPEGEFNMETAYANDQERPDDCIPLYLSPAIPEGWVMVPKEPTYQMSAQGLVHHPFTSPDINSLTESYRAMIAAAPKHGENA